MSIKRLALLIALPTLLLSPFSVARAAIFGADNRRAVTPQSSPELQQMASATAVLILTALRTIDPVTGLVTLDAPPLDNVCSDEPFARDPSLYSSCTGFLVAPDLLVTAGHCEYAANTANHERVNESVDGCATFNWLFDFESSAGGSTQTKNIPRDHLFACKKILYATQTEHAPFIDYALIQLDRPAIGRTPFKLSSAPLTSREAVAMIGYPLGTPMKYSNNGVITLNNNQRDSFLTNLDSFEGNSGSPVFNAQHDVVGILIGGAPSNDFVTDPQRGCDHTSHCSENGLSCELPDSQDYLSKITTGYQGVGSEVQRIGPIVEMLKRLQAGQPAR